MVAAMLAVGQSGYRNSGFCIEPPTVERFSISLPSNVSAFEAAYSRNGLTSPK
jgi:hypothetical protein